MAAFLSLKKTALLPVNAGNYGVYSYFHSQLPATCVQLALSELNNFHVAALQLHGGSLLPH